MKLGELWNILEESSPDNTTNGRQLVVESVDRVTPGEVAQAIYNQHRSDRFEQSGIVYIGQLFSWQIKAMMEKLGLPCSHANFALVKEMCEDFDFFIHN